MKLGLRRFFKNRYRDYCIHIRKTLCLQGLRISTVRSGMNHNVVQALWSGTYEAPEISGLSAVVRSGDKVLELGAGLGIITALAARATGPTGNVLAYEANPSLIEDTRAFLSANGVTNVNLVQAVLVNEANPAPRRFHLAGSFAESSLLGADGRDPQGEVEVAADSLSTILDRFRPDILICDIEGAEVDLLPAMPASMLRAAVVELHPDRLTPAQIASIHAGMASCGLRRQTPGPGGTVEIYARTP